MLPFTRKTDRDGQQAGQARELEQQPQYPRPRTIRIRDFQLPAKHTESAESAGHRAIQDHFDSRFNTENLKSFETKLTGVADATVDTIIDDAVSATISVLRAREEGPIRQKLKEMLRRAASNTEHTKSESQISGTDKRLKELESRLKEQEEKTRRLETELEAIKKRKSTEVDGQPDTSSKKSRLNLSDKKSNEDNNFVPPEHPRANFQTPGARQDRPDPKKGRLVVKAKLEKSLAMYFSSQASQQATMKNEPKIKDKPRIELSGG